jgi:NAD(P)-dependent dehydrogenase (short-subunit alcohol dehydrogenase family)
MQRLRGGLALVTGAGSGIGRATALALARAGMRVVVCDRDAAALDEITRALGDACAMREVVDVGDREAMRAFADRVHAIAPSVDVLVNNAGVAHVGRMIDTPLADWDHVLRVNLGGTIHGCHFFVPNMVAAKKGHVVNVASMVALVALPGVIAYATSKFAVLGMSEAMRAELAPHGVGVSAICPGVIRTNITRAMRLSGSLAAHRGVFDRWGPSFGHDPDTVARAIVRSIGRGGTVPVTIESHALHWLKRTSPRAASLLTATMARMAPGTAR